jgi:hypothetical protein
MQNTIDARGGQRIAINFEKCELFRYFGCGK